MSKLRVYYAPMPSGLEYEGREVMVTQASYSAVHHTYRFVDNHAVCPVLKKGRPKKGQMFLRPINGVYNRWRVEKAEHDFAKHAYLIVGSGTV